MTKCYGQLVACLLACLACTCARLAAQQTPTADAHQHQVARERWQMQGRRVLGQNSAALRLRALQQKSQMRAAQANAMVLSAGSWNQLGPLPLPSDASGTGIQDYSWVSGRATAVVIDPNDPSGNTVFAGGAYGGVWKSTNAGAANANPASVAWAALTDKERTLAIGSLAVQPQLSNPNPSSSIVLAGTGETNGAADSYYGLGILRSSNGGQTWSLMSQDVSGHSFAGLGFSKIAFSTANPNLVVAAAASATEGIIEGLESPVSVNRGIYYSTDAGATWSAARISDASVAITPSSITSVAYNAAGAKFYAAIRFHGFYSSVDGINWTRLTTQPGLALTPSSCSGQTAQPSSCPIYRGEIAVVPNRAGPSGRGEMYVWFVDANDNDQGIWKSLDGGASWVQINDSGITNCGDALGGCGTAQGTFNLALAAVQNGTATDIYAGAVNLYKCTITDTFPTCAGTGDNTFLNLTHVYGCSGIARVHPGQHEIAFQVANGTALLYFANDGGIYRALDGFSGLRSGVCGQSNEFDSLNATLGLITQLVSMTQSLSDPNLILGGTQDNGAPATAFSQTGGSWVNVDAGDNGYTALNPTNENQWFIATPPDSVSGVNLFSCVNGVNCHTIDFENSQVADSNQLEGDTGPFYLPFILDPADPNAIVLGTCRIWRGLWSGGGFSLLSPDFETGGSGACTGEEVNLVRSLAAGGPTDAAGLSQAIYVGTNGEGPLVPTIPGGGRVWVTMNADSGQNSWVDRTGPINPNSFPISGVAIDPGDPSGQTAYVTIMGFHTSHVWRTNDAGIDWTDFTANLPDAPVNSIAIDPATSSGTSTIYVGTDVGVFASSSNNPSWTEIDPPQATPGSLPNVAVTSLRIFNSGGLKRLRAATYGRGIWEWNLITTPDFQINVANNPQTVFAGSTAVFSGTISAVNGYGASVNLGCAAGATPSPQTCSANPSSLVPSTSGTAFALTATDTAGEYLFNLQGGGTDAATTTHAFALTLQVIDFNLGAPSPGTVTVVPGSDSAPVSLTVSAAGPFNAPVNLSCGGLPLDTFCNFQASTTVMPTSGNAAAVTLIVTSQVAAPPGTSQITINAATANGPTKTQGLTLIVSAAPDYMLAISNSSLTTQINLPATFQGALTAVNGYNNAVALSCGSGAPPTCAVNPAQVTPTISGAAFTVMAASGVSQPYNFNINGVGSDAGMIVHSVAVSLTVLPNQSFDFSMGVNPQSASVPVGQQTTYMVDVNPSTGSFPNAVTFACSNLPQLTTCTFNPTQVGTGSGNSNIALTVKTTAPAPHEQERLAALLLLLSFPMAGLFWIRPLRRVSRRTGWTFVSIALVLVCISCGGGLQGNGTTGGGGGTGNPGTPKGTYNLTVTATSGQVTHNAQASLTVQ